MKTFISKVPLSWCTLKGAVVVALIAYGIGLLSNCREIGWNWFTCLLGILFLCIIANLEFLITKLWGGFWIGSAFYGIFSAFCMTGALISMAYLQATKTPVDLQFESVSHIASDRITFGSLCVIVGWSWISLLRRYSHLFYQRRESLPKNTGLA